jgi:hypothetical protein
MTRVAYISRVCLNSRTSRSDHASIALYWLLLWRVATTLHRQTFSLQSLNCVRTYNGACLQPANVREGPERWARARNWPWTRKGKDYHCMLQPHSHGPTQTVLTNHKWEWESYTPGPEVYEQLWCIRKAPAVVTPRLQHHCPIANARTGILDRRQTEGPIQRNYYVVEIAHCSERDSFGANSKFVETNGAGNVEIVEVDMSRILEYVSANELENFENDQFRIEAEAEAIALRAEAEERERKWREKNARVLGVGRGSHMLSGLGMFSHARARGRPRGRGRGRGRGSWPGRGTMVLSSRLRDEELPDELTDDPIESSYREQTEMQRVVAETESEEESSDDDAGVHSSPGLMRSAFVANSALPVSPVDLRRLSTSLAQPRHADPDESDTERSSDLARSMSSAAIQLHDEADDEERIIEDSEDELVQEDPHRSKRRRTESIAADDGLPTFSREYEYDPTAFNQALLFRNRSSLPEAESSLPDAVPESLDEPMPTQSPPAFHSHIRETPEDVREDEDEDTIHVQPPPHSSLEHQPLFDDDADVGFDEVDADAEEYVVEAILEHYYGDGKKYYLVKWEGYEDSHDWLPEEDLEGAQELVAAYNERARKKKKKERMFPSQVG